MPTSIELLLMTNRKLHISFRWTTRLMTLDGLELFEFSGEFRGISQIFQQLNEWR